MTIPSLAAKKARTILIKFLSSNLSPSQSLRSVPRSISSTVQKDPTAFLYRAHKSGYRIGKVVKRSVLGVKIGSRGSAPSQRSCSIVLLADYFFRGVSERKGR